MQLCLLSLLLGLGDLSYVLCAATPGIPYDGYIPVPNALSLDSLGLPDLNAISTGTLHNEALGSHLLQKILRNRFPVSSPLLQSNIAPGVFSSFNPYSSLQASSIPSLSGSLLRYSLLGHNGPSLALQAANSYSNPISSLTGQTAGSSYSPVSSLVGLSLGLQNNPGSFPPLNALSHLVDPQLASVHIHPGIRGLLNPQQKILARDLLTSAYATNPATALATDITPFILASQEIPSGLPKFLSLSNQLSPSPGTLGMVIPNLDQTRFEFLNRALRNKLGVQRARTKHLLNLYNSDVAGLYGTMARHLGNLQKILALHNIGNARFHNNLELQNYANSNLMKYYHLT